MERLIAASLATALILGNLGCTPTSAHVSAAATPATSPVKPATSKPAMDAPSSDGIIVSGPVTVEQQLDVVALRSGVIIALPADVDTAVRKDQVLARLDGRQLDDDRSAAQHKAQSLESDLKNWEAELQVREADMRRAEAMRKEGINTQEAYDHTRYAVTASQYEVERQREEMLGAEANLKSLDLEFEKTKLVAPFNGVVSQRYVRLGQYVTIGDKLFRVVGNSPLEVRFTLPGTDMPLLKRGDLVTVSTTPDFQQTTMAAVTHISPVVDAGSGTIEVTAVLKQKLPGLLPGTIASIRVESER
jgi:membrane fusion protein, multidrug efflux system